MASDVIFTKARADLVDAHALPSEVAGGRPPAFLCVACAALRRPRYFRHYFATPEVRELWRRRLTSLLLNEDRAPAAVVDDGVFEDQRVSI